MLPETGSRAPAELVLTDDEFRVTTSAQEKNAPSSPNIGVSCGIDLTATEDFQETIHKTCGMEDHSSERNGAPTTNNLLNKSFTAAENAPNTTDGSKATASSRSPANTTMVVDGTNTEVPSFMSGWGGTNGWGDELDLDLDDDESGWVPTSSDDARDAPPITQSSSTGLQKYSDEVVNSLYSDQSLSVGSGEGKSNALLRTVENSRPAYSPYTRIRHSASKVESASVSPKKLALSSEISGKPDDVDSRVTEDIQEAPREARETTDKPANEECEAVTTDNLLSKSDAISNESGAENDFHPDEKGTVTTSSKSPLFSTVLADNTAVEAPSSAAGWDGGSGWDDELDINLDDDESGWDPSSFNNTQTVAPNPQTVPGDATNDSHSEPIPGADPLSIETNTNLSIQAAENESPARSPCIPAVQSVINTESPKRSGAPLETNNVFRETSGEVIGDVEESVKEALANQDNSPRQNVVVSDLPTKSPPILHETKVDEATKLSDFDTFAAVRSPSIAKETTTEALSSASGWGASGWDDDFELNLDDNNNAWVSTVADSTQSIETDRQGSPHSMPKTHENAESVLNTVQTPSVDPISVGTNSNSLKQPTENAIQATSPHTPVLKPSVCAESPNDTPISVENVDATEKTGHETSDDVQEALEEVTGTVDNSPEQNVIVTAPVLPEKSPPAIKETEPDIVRDTSTTSPVRSQPITEETETNTEWLSSAGGWGGASGWDDDLDLSLDDDENGWAQTGSNDMQLVDRDTQPVYQSVPGNSENVGNVIGVEQIPNTGPTSVENSSSSVVQSVEDGKLGSSPHTPVLQSSGCIESPKDMPTPAKSDEIAGKISREISEDVEEVPEKVIRTMDNSPERNIIVTAAVLPEKSGHAIKQTEAHSVHDASDGGAMVACTESPRLSKPLSATIEAESLSNEASISHEPIVADPWAPVATDASYPISSAQSVPFPANAEDSLSGAVTSSNMINNDGDANLCTSTTTDNVQPNAPGVESTVQDASNYSDEVMNSFYSDQTASADPWSVEDSNSSAVFPADNPNTANSPNAAATHSKEEVKSGSHYESSWVHLVSDDSQWSETDTKPVSQYIPRTVNNAENGSKNGKTANTDSKPAEKGSNLVIGLIESTNPVSSPHTPVLQSSMCVEPPKDMPTAVKSVSAVGEHDSAIAGNERKAPEDVIKAVDHSPEQNVVVTAAILPEIPPPVTQKNEANKLHCSNDGNTTTTHTNSPMRLQPIAQETNTDSNEMRNAVDSWAPVSTDSSFPVPAETQPLSVYSTNYSDDVMNSFYSDSASKNDPILIEKSTHSVAGPVENTNQMHSRNDVLSSFYEPQDFSGAAQDGAADPWAPVAIETEFSTTIEQAIPSPPSGVAESSISAVSNSNDRNVPDSPNNMQPYAPGEQSTSQYAPNYSDEAMNSHQKPYADPWSVEESTRSAVLPGENASVASSYAPAHSSMNKFGPDSNDGSLRVHCVSNEPQLGETDTQPIPRISDNREKIPNIEHAAVTDPMSVEKNNVSGHLVKSASSGTSLHTPALQPPICIESSEDKPTRVESVEATQEVNWEIAGGGAPNEAGKIVDNSSEQNVVVTAAILPEEPVPAIQTTGMDKLHNSNDGGATTAPSKSPMRSEPITEETNAEWLSSTNGWGGVSGWDDDLNTSDNKMSSAADPWVSFAADKSFPSSSVEFLPPSGTEEASSSKETSFHETRAADPWAPVAIPPAFPATKTEDVPSVSGREETTSTKTISAQDPSHTQNGNIGSRVSSGDTQPISSEAHPSSVRSTKYSNDVMNSFYSDQAPNNDPTSSVADPVENTSSMYSRNDVLSSFYEPQDFSGSAQQGADPWAPVTTEAVFSATPQATPLTPTRVTKTPTNVVSSSTEPTVADPWASVGTNTSFPVSNTQNVPFPTTFGDSLSGEVASPNKPKSDMNFWTSSTTGNAQSGAPIRTQNPLSTKGTETLTNEATSSNEPIVADPWAPVATDTSYPVTSAQSVPFPTNAEDSLSGAVTSSNKINNDGDANLYTSTATDNVQPNAPGAESTVQDTPNYSDEVMNSFYSDQTASADPWSVEDNSSSAVLPADNPNSAYSPFTPALSSVGKMEADPYSSSNSTPAVDAASAWAPYNSTELLNPYISESSALNRPYAQSFSIMDSAMPDDRQTPRAFMTWGFGGSLVVLTPRGHGSIHGDASNRSIVSIYDMSTIAQDNANESWTAALETVAALEPSSSNLSTYADMCDRLATYSLGTDRKESESLSYMWRFLAVLCRNPRGNWYPKLADLLAARLAVPLFNPETSEVQLTDSPIRASSEQEHVNSENNLTRAAIQVESLLTSGRSADAVSVAQNSRLWPLALIISASIDQTTFMKAVADYARETLVDGTALQTLCLAQSGNDNELADVATSAEGIRNWKKTISVLLNRMGSPNSPGREVKVIENIGVMLDNREKDLVAAHLCYLISGKIRSLALDSGVVTLLGADESTPSGRPGSMGSIIPILQSVVYEAIYSVQHNQRFPHLLPFRLLIVYELIFVGKLDCAYQHVQNIVSSVRSILESGAESSNLLTAPFLSQLESVDVQLRNRLNGTSASTGGKLMALKQSISSVFKKSTEALLSTSASVTSDMNTSVSQEFQKTGRNTPDIPGPVSGGVVPSLDSHQLATDGFSQRSPYPSNYGSPESAVVYSQHQGTIHSSSSTSVGLPSQPQSISAPHLYGHPQTMPTSSNNLSVASTGMAFNQTRSSTTATSSIRGTRVPGEATESKSESGWNSFVANTIKVLAPAEGDLSPPPVNTTTDNFRDMPVSPRSQNSSGLSHMRSASVGDVPSMIASSDQRNVWDINQRGIDSRRYSHAGFEQPNQSGRSEQSASSSQHQAVSENDQRRTVPGHRRTTSDITHQIQASESRPPRPPRRDNEDNDEGREKSKGSGSAWFRRSRFAARLLGAFGAPKQAHMGEENKFVFDKALGRWVIPGEPTPDLDESVEPPPDDDELSNSGFSNFPDSRQQTPDSMQGQISNPIQDASMNDLSNQTLGPSLYGNPPMGSQQQAQFPTQPARSFSPSIGPYAESGTLSGNVSMNDSNSQNGFGDNMSETSVQSAMSAPGPRRSMLSDVPPPVATVTNRYRAGRAKLSGRRAYVDTFNPGSQNSMPTGIPAALRPPSQILPSLSTGNMKIFTPAPAAATSSSNTQAQANWQSSALDETSSAASGNMIRGVGELDDESLHQQTYSSSSFVESSPPAGSSGVPPQSSGRFSTSYLPEPAQVPHYRSNRNSAPAPPGPRMSA